MLCARYVYGASERCGPLLSRSKCGVSVVKNKRRQCIELPKRVKFASDLDAEIALDAWLQTQGADLDNTYEGTSMVFRSS